MSDHSEKAKQIKKSQWERALVDANGFDQVKSLIENWRADESALDPDPQSNNIFEVAMMHAIEAGDVPLVKYLLEQGAPLGRMVGLWAVVHSPPAKRIEIMETLYRHGWDLDQVASSGTTIIGHCSKDETATRWMLSHGANPNPDVPANKSPLNIAAGGASIDTVRLLLEKGADPSKSNALRFAIKREEGWKEIIELLLNYGCDINAFQPQGFRAMRGSYPGSVLHVAAALNLHEKIPFLLDKGADLHKKSENGFTPSELALNRGCEEAARALDEAERRSAV